MGLRVHPGRPAQEPEAPVLLLLGWRESPGGPFEETLEEGVAAAARRAGYRVLRKSLGTLEEAFGLAREGLLRDAVVSYYRPAAELTEASRRLRAEGVRVCAVDQEVEGLDCVLLDNRAIGRLAARYMFSRRGFRRALIMRRYYLAQAEYEREEGICEVLQELAVGHERVSWMSAFLDREVVCRQLAGFLAAGFRFDLFFCHLPGLAAEVRAFVKERTGTEPLAVAVGEESELREHGVDGVAVSPEEMGKRAVELLMERRQEPFRKPRTVRLEGRILIP